MPGPLRAASIHVARSLTRQSTRPDRLAPLGRPVAAPEGVPAAASPALAFSAPHEPCQFSAGRRLGGSRLPPVAFVTADRPAVRPLIVLEPSPLPSGSRWL